MKKPTAILSADWHIRGDRPLCRTDDYMKAQEEKIKYIFELANEYSCPILVAGDFGHRPYWGDELLNWFMDIVGNIDDEYETEDKILMIAGQHDLPNHRLDKWEEAGLGVLNKTYASFEVLTEYYPKVGYTIYPFPYSVKIKEQVTNNDRSIALAHQMVIKSPVNKLWGEQKANSAKKLLKQFPCYDLIVTGDNHQSFAMEYEGRWLVNPGSIMRMTAAQITHEPCVYEWYAEENFINKVSLVEAGVVKGNVIDTSHITDVKERDERIDAFITKLGGSYDMGFSFEDNLKAYLSQNKNKKGVVKKIWESLE